jgi:hypothetical protein
MDRYFVQRGKDETLQVWSRELDGTVGFARPWETAGETLMFSESDAIACVAANGGEIVAVPPSQTRPMRWLAPIPRLPS